MVKYIFIQVRTLFIIPNPVAPHGISEETIFETRTKGEMEINEIILNIHGYNWIYELEHEKAEKM